MEPTLSFKSNKETLKRYKSINLSEASVPYIFNNAKGSYIYDTEGVAKLDFTSGYGVANTGWMHPKVLEAVHKQLKKSTYGPPWLATEAALDLSEMLLKISPEGMAACLRATGGSEAMEGALRAVFALTPKRTLVSFHRSYHGGTSKSIKLSDYQSFHLLDMPISPHRYIKVPFPNLLHDSNSIDTVATPSQCLENIEELFKTNADIAAFVAEPVIGSGGVLIPPQGFMLKLQHLCHQYNVLFILDEVITGFGRVGSFTAAELMGLNPDAILFAKGMGSGYVPIGCAMLNEPLSDALRQYEDVSPTFAWTPLACAATLANLEVIAEEGLCEKATYTGNKLLAATNDLFRHYLPENTREVRGIGMMIGVSLVEPNTKKPATRLVQKLLLSFFNEGLMCCADWDSHTLILMPPLTLSEPELGEGLLIMEKVLARFK